MTQALGHANFQYVSKFIIDELVDGYKMTLKAWKWNCNKIEIGNVSLENNRTKFSEILELIHNNLNSAYNTNGYGGDKYFLTFIDYTKCTIIFCIKNITETATCFKEFVNRRRKSYKKGIELLPWPPCVHYLYEAAKRYNSLAFNERR